MPRYACLSVVSVACFALLVASADDHTSIVPPRLAPFEHLVGEWNSNGFLEASKTTSGWLEKAVWGWKFEKGKIAALEVSFDKGKYFTKGLLSPLDEDGMYRFVATTADKKPVTYAGTLKGKSVVFARQGDEIGPEQFTLGLLHDVRYVLTVEARKAGSMRKVATIGSTRAGVKFGAVADVPKCVVTGAPGTSSVMYKGIAYPVCCSGCRAEFEVDPEKWLRLAREKAKADKPASAGNTKEPTPDPPDSKATEPKAKKGDPKADTSKTRRAAGLLKQAKLLEQNQRAEKAIELYRQIVQEHPDTSEAKEATAALQRLGAKPQ